jgi:hypothetical protein
MGNISQMKRKKKEIVAMKKRKPRGLYRDPGTVLRRITRQDQREQLPQNKKLFRAGIKDDIGDLSFAQEALAELAFCKFYILAEYLHSLKESGKNGLLKIITDEKINRTFNATANSFRLDLKEIYGAAGLRRAEKNLQDLESYLSETYGKKEEGDGEN